MNNLATEQKDPDQLRELKRLTTTVYLCQALSLIFAALPLLVGVAINFYKRNEVQGTWLESHFNWQIKTCWVAIAGIAVSGLTFAMGIGIFTLFMTIFWMVYRITIGWNALTASKPINNKIN
ncbi:hypothetical protein AU255_13605 [Methyloprofundus sedimenti]|uniref:Transmembrane protein n=1 Tax=Methyloprofundus sedimenti TaxID=1420851 RepID=A0A1V8M3S5_9GAMM|nr:hypothetical protein [Methyloprofundus sedimenti]OQK16136.1 hypothetical protein AU255_13605 [Methyloprofundus sedimenti]